MALALTGVQFFGSATPPPLVLYLFFTAVWIFGAVLLWTTPKFGAYGTAAYGVILGIDILAMHATDAVVSAIAIGSFFATLLALGTLWVR